MRQFFRQSHVRVIVTILLLGLLTIVGGFWWICTRSNGIAFLPAKAGAEWIVYPNPPDATIHRAVPVRAVFRHTFTLSPPSANANVVMTVCAFKSAVVIINGQTPGNLVLDGENWKSPLTADVTGLLQAGTNFITVYVTNTFGPPALWLRLQAGRLSLGTDERWEVSLAGAAWQQASPASQPSVILPWSYLHGGERTLDSARRVWPVIAVFGAMSLALVLATDRWLRRRCAPELAGSTSTKLIYGFLFLVVVARSILLFHNLPLLPRTMGFDAVEHEKYVQFIQEKCALPLAKDGWEMFQPPFYYAASAFLLDMCDLEAGKDRATMLLRGMNGVIGLIHCWLVLLCLRLLFPKNPAAQAVGLLIAAFLPAHLYLSQYVTNEPLASLFVTVAFYLCLRSLRSEKESLPLHLGIGAALGAAMLTKFSSVLAVPFFPVALGLRLFSRKDHAPSDWLRSVGAIVISCLVVCGWHYGHAWAQFGKPMLGNWETDSAFASIQDPCFRTSAYYLSFGQVLASPLFSGFHSFADGFYSTLWGDGLISGATRLAFRPPWNYDFMNAEYLLALVISLLFVVGLVAALVRFIRQPTLEWLVMLGLVSVFGLGVIYMSLRVPFYSEGKAFYAFPALVPFSALVVVGWNWLGQKNRVVRIVLWVVLLVWTLTVYTALWIRNNNPETYRVRGIYQITQQRYAEAFENLSQVLRLKPGDADTHCILAEILGDQDKALEAVQHYREALRIRPDFPEALNNLALMLATSEEADIKDTARAVQLAERACELTLHDTPAYISTLAVTYAEAGRFDDAIATAQKACEVASESGDKDLLKKNQEFLASNMNHLAQALVANKEAKIRNGVPAVQLAELACELTGFKQTLMVGTLAAAYAEAGRFDDAISMAEKACALASESGEQDWLRKYQEFLVINLNNLAWRLATCPDAHIRNGTQAVTYAERACALTHYGVAPIVGTLAAAYAEDGRFDDAIAAAQKACALASESGDQNLLKRNQELMELYRKHQPYHETVEKTVPAIP